MKSQLISISRYSPNLNTYMSQLPGIYENVEISLINMKKQDLSLRINFSILLYLFQCRVDE